MIFQPASNILVPFMQPQFRRGRVSGGGDPIEFVTGQTLGSARTDGGGYYVGFRFTVGAAPITITHIGRWVPTVGAAQSQVHDVYVSSAAGAILEASTINAALGTPGEYQWVELNTPVVCSAATGYGVLCEEFSGNDTFYNSDTTVTTETDATINRAVYSDPAGGQALFDDGAGNAFGPVSFKYTV
jgi:hypothetical protein